MARKNKACGKKAFLSHGAAFLSGLCLTLALIIFSVLILLTNTGLFHRALEKHVKWEAMGIPPEDIFSFAEETMAYFRDETSQWQPVIRTRDGLLPVAQNFTEHMASVKQGVQILLRLGIFLGSGAALLLVLSFFLLPDGFSRKGYVSGMLTPLASAAIVCIVALVDFQSFWFWLHEHFIPDGIFSAGEPIMRMFPLSLFFSYIVPLLLLLTAAVGLLLLPLIFSRKTAARNLK